MVQRATDEDILDYWEKPEIRDLIIHAVPLDCELDFGDEDSGSDQTDYTDYNESTIAEYCKPKQSVIASTGLPHVEASFAGGVSVESRLVWQAYKGLLYFQ